ncbi:hypothetical protein FRC09_005344 [Ceratobasidium sp. 395]|nr:hypothetical protein FRC09_005344 [Ceratobasidium sp. 395]
MFRQQHPRSAARHIPTPYDGHELGRDDPVWSCYVKEAKTWDNDLVDGWNQGMDILLRSRALTAFISTYSIPSDVSKTALSQAGLFSAIVTAFVIESYKSLQQDNAQVAAEGIVRMTELLQAIAAGERLNATNSTSAQPSFQPTSAAIVVNFTWFLSLGLSIIVALVAMLVKQWGQGYRSGSDLAPPCTHARIRQSRFDMLKRWKTEDIVLVLPVVMHAALGLFLTGLLVFLWDLNRYIAVPMMVVVSITFTGYLLMTIVPLQVAFCPYSTPVTSRILWGYLVWCLWYLFFRSANPTDRAPELPCQQKEKEISDKNAPDSVTGQALDWLITHSKDEAVVDVAIRAIAGAELSDDVWRLLTKDSLIILVAQKFTASFNGALDQDITTQLEMDDERLEIASLYGRALANIAKHKNPFDVRITQAQYSTFGPGVPPLTDDQTLAVTRGLEYLASRREVSVAAFGITSVSIWYMFTGWERAKWEGTIIQSFRIILDRIKENTEVHPAALAGLIDSLPIQMSYWNQGLSKQEKRDVLLPLVELLRLRDGWTDQLKEHISLVLAVLAISVNDYPDFRTIEEANYWEYTYDEYPGLVDAHFEAAVRIRDSSRISHNTNFHPRSNPASNARWRMWRANQASRIYTIHPKLRKEHSEALFLLGLAGLLTSFGLLGLDDVSSHIASAVADHLGRMTVLNISQPISLPFVFPTAFDIRAYAVDQVMHKLRPSLYENQQGVFDDDSKAKLLASFSEKHQLWVDFGAQLSLPVIEMLHLTDSWRLQKQCLISMEEHSLTDPFPHKWDLFSYHEIPHKLVQIVQKNDDDLPSRAMSSFKFLSQQFTVEHIKNRFSFPAILESLLHDELFETFVVDMVCRAPPDLMKVWRDEIVSLPGFLASDPDSETKRNSLKQLRQFCSKHPISDLETSWMNSLIIRLSNTVLSEHHTDSVAQTSISSVTQREENNSNTVS